MVHETLHVLLIKGENKQQSNSKQSSGKKKASTCHFGVMLVFYFTFLLCLVADNHGLEVLSVVSNSNTQVLAIFEVMWEQCYLYIVSY